MILLRGAYFSTRAVEAGTWPRQTLSQGREAAGKVIGIVGFGNIGRLTALKAAALGMKVIGHDPQVAENDAAWASAGTRRSEFGALLEESDVVSLHIPLTPETRGLLDEDRLSRMKRDAVVINTARGGYA
jgi:(S)-sulfolactate dehydrogenase